jgi:hypothetical protein
MIDPAVRTARYCQNEECDYKMTVDTIDLAPDGKKEDTVSA